MTTPRVIPLYLPDPYRDIKSVRVIILLKVNYEQGVFAFSVNRLPLQGFSELPTWQCSPFGARKTAAVAALILFHLAYFQRLECHMAIRICQNMVPYRARSLPSYKLAHVLFRR